MIVNEHESTPTKIAKPPCDYQSVKASALERDTNNVANYINIKKIVGKNESNYYYSHANYATRKKVGKIIRKNRSKQNLDDLDDSVHSRIKLIKHCIKASAYKGPPPVKKDGSAVESIIKKRQNNHVWSLTSADSTHRSSITSESSYRSSGFKSNITFSHVDIREYERIAGDNPCVSMGVPLSIGWAHYQHKPIPIEEYEIARGPPRDRIEMIVPVNIRRTMLRDEFKVPIADINQSMKWVNTSKRQRANTIASDRMEVFAEVVESAKRKFKRMVGKAVSTSTRKQAEELWQASHDAAMAEYLEQNEGKSLKDRYDDEEQEVGELLEKEVGELVDLSILSGTSSSSRRSSASRRTTL